MRRGFVRAIWGDRPRQTDKIRKEVLLAKEHDIPIGPSKVICWGRENYDHVVSAGFDAVLVSEQPYAYPPETIFTECGRKFVTGEACGRFWHHKMLSLDIAFNHFDEFIFVDWDILPRHPLPSDFWERFQAKEAIQATLFVYHVRQIPWKLIDMRKVISAAFIYLRDPSIVKQLLTISAENPTWREELCIMYLIDVVRGHFPRTADQLHNVRVYNERYEPWCAEFKNNMSKHLGRKKDEIEKAVFRW